MGAKRDFFPPWKRHFENFGLMRENFGLLEVSFFRWQLLFLVSRRKSEVLSCTRFYSVENATSQ